MRCPHCYSTDLKKASLIYAGGVYQSRGRMGGLLLGSGDAFFVGKYKGANQSLLSKMVGPLRKAPYVAPVILWVMGFFIVMAFAGRGKLLWMMGALSMGYALTLPVYLLVALFYNFFLRPKKKTEWEGKFLCQRCGLVWNPHESHRLATGSPA